MTSELCLWMDHTHLGCSKGCKIITERRKVWRLQEQNFYGNKGLHRWSLLPSTPHPVSYPWLPRQQGHVCTNVTQMELTRKLKWVSNFSKDKVCWKLYLPQRHEIIRWLWQRAVSMKCTKSEFPLYFTQMWVFLLPDSSASDPLNKSLEKLRSPW